MDIARSAPQGPTGGPSERLHPVELGRGRWKSVIGAGEALGSF